MGLEEVVSLWVRISIGISAGDEDEVEVDAGRFKFAGYQIGGGTLLI